MMKKAYILVSLLLSICVVLGCGGKHNKLDSDNNNNNNNKNNAPNDESISNSEPYYPIKPTVPVYSTEEYYDYLRTDSEMSKLKLVPAERYELFGDLESFTLGHNLGHYCSYWSEAEGTVNTRIGFWLGEGQTCEKTKKAIYENVRDDKVVLAIETRPEKGIDDLYIYKEYVADYGENGTVEKKLGNLAIIFINENYFREYTDGDMMLNDGFDLSKFTDYKIDCYQVYYYVGEVCYYYSWSRVSGFNFMFIEYYDSQAGGTYKITTSTSKDSEGCVFDRGTEFSKSLVNVDTHKAALEQLFDIEL